MAFAYREVLEDFADGTSIATLRISGGGRSPFWRQILADVLNRPLDYYAADSTLGAAMVAAIGGAFYPDLATTVAAMVRAESRTDPASSHGAL